MVMIGVRMVGTKKAQTIRNVEDKIGLKNIVKKFRFTSSIIHKYVFVCNF